VAPLQQVSESMNLKRISYKPIFVALS
jgi:hypothetical protein